MSVKLDVIPAVLKQTAVIWRKVTRVNVAKAMWTVHQIWLVNLEGSAVLQKCVRRTTTAVRLLFVNLLEAMNTNVRVFRATLTSHQVNKKAAFVFEITLAETAN